MEQADNMPTTNLKWLNVETDENVNHKNRLNNPTLSPTYSPNSIANIRMQKNNINQKKSTRTSLSGKKQNSELSPNTVTKKKTTILKKVTVKPPTDDLFGRQLPCINFCRKI